MAGSEAQDLALHVKLHGAHDAPLRAAPLAGSAGPYRFLAGRVGRAADGGLCRRRRRVEVHAVLGVGDPGMQAWEVVCVEEGCALGGAIRVVGVVVWRWRRRDGGE